MAFRDCLLSAVEQGAISREEADRLQAHFDEEFAQARMSLGDEAASAAARGRMEKALRAEAIENRRVVLLQDAAQDRIAGYLAGFRNIKGRPDVFAGAINLLENFGYAGTSSVAGRSKAIVALAHGQMADVLSVFRRSWATGGRFNRPLLADVVREMLGEASGQPQAKVMAEAVGSVFETLRQRFNAAGGAIGKIEGGYLPQYHDPKALLSAGREAWKDFVRPRLDREKMRDPLTGDALTDARLDQVLDASFDAVVADGWATRKPQAISFGRGALASQRAEHRFLHFKNADAWLEYNASFGKGDPVKAIFEHVNGMARDIATMEVLGPNPGATVEWIKQLVQHEAGKALAGKPSLYDMGNRKAAAALAAMNYAPWRIDSLYQYVRGRQVVSGQVATGFGNVRNVLTSAFLGSAAVTAAWSDPVIDRAVRSISGLPAAKGLWAIVDGMKRGTREQAVRSGLILDDFLHVLGDEARFVGQLGGSEWSRWLADRTVQLSGLEPITQARRHVFGLDFQATVADAAASGWDDLSTANPYLRRTMEGYGLDRTAWDVIRATEAFAPNGGAGFIRPADVAALAGGPALPKVQKLLGIDAGDAAVARDQTAAGVRRIAEQYLEMILGQTERAVPTGTARARSFVTGAAPRGTAFGEILESGLQFKSFALSFMTLQWQAIQAEVHAHGLARGASYAASFIVPLTLGGAVAFQLKNMATGKDPMPMDDPRFWLQAAQTGGGFGLFGDFLFADVNRFGQPFAATLAGPIGGAIDDATRFSLGNIRQALQGKKTNAGREAVNLLGRYVPVVSSLWYTRAAYRRVLLDQLQYLADPEAHKAFREQEKKMHRETGQDFFWRPGHTAPDRPPDLSRALGR